MITAKYNATFLDPTKIDFKTLENTHISSEAERFGAKASVLTLYYHSLDVLSFEYKYNILELFEDDTPIFIGYLNKARITYSKRKKLYTLVFYSVLKLLTEVNFPYETMYVGRKADEILAEITDSLNQYISENSSQFDHLSSATNLVFVGDSITAKYGDVGDIAGNIYDLTNNKDDGCVGLRLGVADGIIFFAEPKNNSYTNHNYYFGVLSGSWALYFCDSDAVRDDFYSYEANAIFNVNIINNVIIFYYQVHADNDSARIYYIIYGMDGKRKTSGNITQSPDVDYIVKYDINHTPPIWVETGTHNVCNINTNILLPNGSAYVINDTTPVIAYSGTMYHNLYYPFAYPETPTALKVLQDMAIYFDAFFAIKNNQIILISQAKCGSVNLGEAIDDKMIGITEMNYDFVNILPTLTVLKETLDGYYYNQYGDETIKYSRTYRSENNATITDKVDGCRIIDLKKRNLANGRYEYKIQVIE